MSRLGRTLGGILAVLTLPATGAAQLPPGPPPLAPGTGIIVGQVLDAATGRGVSSAVVTLAGSRRVMTTTDGRFAFRSLPEGSHTLTAAKSGYIDGAYGMRRPGGPTLPVVLADGERRGNLVIWLWRHGAITGTIVDEAGEPLTGIQVTALRRSIVGGRRRFVQGGTGTTDDRGIYRIARLAPGDYAVAMTTSQVSIPVSAARQYEESMMAGGDFNRNPILQAMVQVGAMPGLMGGTDSRQVGDEMQTLGRGAPTPPPADGQRLFAYPSLFYPSAPSAVSATMVSVASGQERTGIDLQVRPVPMVKLSGTVTGQSPTSAANLPVRLVPQGSDDLGRTADVGGTITTASGGFTFLGVPSGNYTIKIVQIPRSAAPSAPPMTISVGSGMMISGSFAPNPEVPPIPAEPTMWANVPVSIGDADVTGVNIALNTGLRVSGRIEFEGAADKPTPEQLSRIPVMLEPVDGQMDRNVTPPGRIDAKGQFTSYGLPAGRYYVRSSAPTGWTLKGAFLGERDLSDVALDLESTDVADVVLTFTDRPASLSGTVQMTERAARDGVAVIVFPADSKAWMETGVNPRRMRKVATTDTGAYNVTPLPAGAYYVAALSETVAGEWQDPAFLEQLAASAAHVQIDNGEKATMSLRLLEIR
jgi:uncharacterized protein (DUF2141 family)